MRGRNGWFVKFLLVPLLIIWMFVSFTAALLAMLFFTETVKSPAKLAEMVLGEYDFDTAIRRIPRS
jgi:hypothetical protein